MRHHIFRTAPAVALLAAALAYTAPRLAEAELAVAEIQGERDTLFRSLELERQGAARRLEAAAAALTLATEQSRLARQVASGDRSV